MKIKTLNTTAYLTLFFILISLGAGSNMAFAEPLTLFPTTFVDSFSVAAQDDTPWGLAFSSEGTKMFVIGYQENNINEYTLSSPFDVSTATFVDSFSVAGQITDALGLAFSSDGTKMFVIDGMGPAVKEYILSTGFDVSTATFEDSFSVAGLISNPLGLAFNSDGTKMFVVDNTVGDISEYTLSTGFDVTTGAYVGSFSVTAQGISPLGLAFNSDGTKMFVVDDVGNNINEYSLFIGFTVSTATFVDSFSVAAQSDEPTGLAFSSDGTKMFVVSNFGDSVNEYTLSAGFTLFHTTFVNSFSVTGQGIFPTGVAFSSDGTKMFVLDNGDDIYEYTLSTGFDVSTATFVGSLSVAGQVTNTTDLAFSSDGKKMFVLGGSLDGDVTEYTLSSPFDVSTATFVDSFSVTAQELNPRIMALSSDGTKMFVGGFGGNVHEYTLSTGFDVSTATFVDSFSVAAQDTSPSGLAFSSDGTKMFVVDGNGDDINKYTLSSQFDVSTATFAYSSVAGQINDPSGIAFSSDGTKMFVVSFGGRDVNEFALVDKFTLFHTTFVDSFSVAAQDTSPLGLAFSSDGTKMFVVGGNGDSVNEYTLSSPFDVSTASFVDSFSVAAQDITPAGLAFSSDGTKMFVTGIIGTDINEYTLSSPFDVSTATFVDSFSVAAQDSAPFGLAFSSDGTKMFVTGIIGTDINEYTLSSPFDVSTATFVDSFSVAAQDIAPAGIAFSFDGTKMFVVGGNGTDINEYTLSSPFDVSTATFVDSFSVAAQDASPLGLAFSSNGAKMFVVGGNDNMVNEYSITLSRCSLPSSGTWVLESSCRMTSSATSSGNVLLQNNSVLVVQNGIVLIIPSGFNITIPFGSGVAIDVGGMLTVQS